MCTTLPFSIFDSRISTFDFLIFDSFLRRILCCGKKFMFWMIVEIFFLFWECSAPYGGFRQTDSGRRFGILSDFEFHELEWELFF